MKRQYESSFKRMAVELVNSGKIVREVSEDLGIPFDTLRNWVRLYKKEGVNSFLGDKKPLTAEQRENLRLKRELRAITEERDILKKAVSIFSKSDRKGTNS